MIPQGHQKPEHSHERKDADVLGVALVATLVFLIVALSFLTVRGLLDYAERGREPSLAASTPAKFPQPRLEVHPAADLAAARAANEAELHSYGWIDRKTGAARVPIERAMQLLVTRGLPAVGAGQTRLQLMKARPVTETAPNESNASPTPEVSP
jgi:hypothetical protein